MLSHNISLILGVTDRCSGFFFWIRIGLRKLLSIPFADFNCDRSGVRLWSPESRTRHSYFRSWDGIESLCGSFPRTEPTNQHGRGNATNYVILFLFPMVFAFFLYFFRWLVLSHFQIGWLQPGPMEPLSVHSISASGLIWPRDKKEKR